MDPYSLDHIILPALRFRFKRTVPEAPLEAQGLEPWTLGLQSRCSSQLSHAPSPAPDADGKRENQTWKPYTGRRFPSLADCVFSVPAGCEMPAGLFPFLSWKGGDPAAPSGTATLLRLHPPHQTYLYLRLGWCDGRCVQGPGTYSPRHADARLLAIPTSWGRVAGPNPYWDRLSAVRSAFRPRFALYLPL